MVLNELLVLQNNQTTSMHRISEMIFQNLTGQLPAYYTKQNLENLSQFSESNQSIFQFFM
jgi:hypothetical protein